MMNEKRHKIMPIKIEKGDIKNNTIKSQDENILIEYTDSHFMNQLNIGLEPFAQRPIEVNEQKLDKLRNTPLYKLNRGSNSPITLSNSSSESDFFGTQEYSDELIEQNLMKVSNLLIETSNNNYNSDVTKAIGRTELYQISNVSTSFNTAIDPNDINIEENNETNIKETEEPHDSVSLKTTIDTNHINIEENNETNIKEPHDSVSLKTTIDTNHINIEENNETNIKEPHDSVSLKTTIDTNHINIEENNETNIKETEEPHDSVSLKTTIDTNIDDTTENGFVLNKPKRFRKLTFKEVDNSLDEYISENKISNELEIIVTYLNGQKNLYIRAKKFTQNKLNLLMVPTLILSTFVTILSPFICSYAWSDTYIVVLNASITLLISLVNYYKLESTYQMYGHIACQYDKLQTVLEMANSRLMFLDNEIEQKQLVVRKLKEFEEKIFEIKDGATIFVPDDIKIIFPIISHINIFSFIKRIETYKKSLTLKYCDVKNEMRYIIYKCEAHNSNDERLRLRLTFLIDIKDKIKDELIDYKNAYSYMDDAFVREIRYAENYKFLYLHRLMGRHVTNDNLNHPIILKHVPNL